ncbi:ester cyclase [Streptacidiphilus monticola]
MRSHGNPRNGGGIHEHPGRQQADRGALRRDPEQPRPEPAGRAVRARHGQPLAGPRSAGRAGRHPRLPRHGGRSWQTEHWRQSYVVAEDDLVVQFGVRAGHWPGGDFFGYPMPSGDFTREVAFMYRVTDGRIAERWAVRDDLGLLHRLGALPARSG